MPVKVPEEPKVYTAVYDNLKGVDFTNDASNVWRHRSPSGKNMLPDLDGRPYKRTGWDIEVTAQEFRDAAGVGANVEVIPDKTYYFELGGYDFLMIFNNLGVFTYRRNPVEAQQQIYPRLLVHQKKYIPINSSFDPESDDPSGLPAFPPTIDGQNVPIDSGRAFFFEGRGTAGFYLFVGLKLFRYDGAYFREEEPYAPLVLFGCDKNGTGTILEDLNMLTPLRAVQYYCDGTTSEYVIPGGIDTSKGYEVFLRDSDGEWAKQTSGYSYASGKIDFDTPPTAPDGNYNVDNLRVVYAPDGAGSSVTESIVNTAEKTIWVKKVTTQIQTMVDNGIAQSNWLTSKTTYTCGGQTPFDIPNIKINNQTKAKEITIQCRNSTNTDWTTMNSAHYGLSYGAYNETAKITPKQALFSSTAVPKSKTSKTTGKATAWKVYESFRAAWTETVTEKGKKVKKKVMRTHYRKRRTRTITEYHYYRVRVQYTKYEYEASNQKVNESVTAFTQCTRALVFGSGIINQVFMSGSPYPAYNTRVWYSAATDPTYFPDTNYIEVGATDKPIMGMMKVGEYLGVIKQGVSFDTSIYLAYPTSFDDNTTYAVKQNINGIGAVSNGAFNTLNEEPLFLSKDGVMGIEVSTEDTDRQLRNRSYFVNKRLCGEDNLKQAISFVYNGLYYLGINNRCYVLDGSQKSSWANTKTNLQYECYYLENVPAQCFARFDDELYFTDFRGNLCRFKSEGDNNTYRDAYSIGDPYWYALNAPTVDDTTYFNPTDLVMLSADTEADSAKTYYSRNEQGTFTVVVDTEGYNPVDEGWYEQATSGSSSNNNQSVEYQGVWYTITSGETDKMTVEIGVPIDAVWSTIADDDGSPHYFKNLKKKGTMISLLPSSDSGVSVYIKPDSKNPIFVGETDAKDYELPYDFYSKKKVKKYKRLQFICENNVLDDSFGVDQIVKSYTVGNYSKNRSK